jgi:hypothetical protein
MTIEAFRVVRNLGATSEGSEDPRGEVRWRYFSLRSADFGICGPR